MGGLEPLSRGVWKLSAQGILAKDGAYLRAFSPRPEIANLIPQPNLPGENSSFSPSSGGHSQSLRVTMPVAPRRGSFRIQ